MSVLNKDKILEAAKDFVTQGKIDKAIKEYEKILSLDPADMRVKLRIAELFIKRRQIAEAIKVYLEVAQSYAHEGFHLKSVTIYKSVLRLNPSLLEINQALAELYEKMGLSKDAILQYEILAQAFEQRGQVDEALKLKEKLVELSPDKAVYRIKLAEGYQRAGRHEDSIQQYEILAKQYREQKQEPKKLIDLYERILPHRPEDKVMLTELVRLHHEAKDWKSSLKWLEKYKTIVSLDTHLLGIQAEIYGTTNQLDSARQKYQELADLFLDVGDQANALKAYEEILVLLPEEAETVKGLVEEVDGKLFDDLNRRAAERRVQRAEEIRLQEEALEKEKELKEKQRQEEQKTKKKEKIKKAAPAESSAPEIPTAPGAAAKQAPLIFLSKEELEKLLNAARTSLSLVKAYRETGLADEAKLESKHAQAAIKRILESDPQNQEATDLLSELGVNRSDTNRDTNRV